MTSPATQDSPPKRGGVFDRIGRSSRTSTHLLVVLVVSALATLYSYKGDALLLRLKLGVVLKVLGGGAGVGGIFLAATYLLVLRNRDNDVRASGLAFGGLLEVPPKPLSTCARELVVALAWAVGVSLFFFVPFTLAFVRWWHVQKLGFSLGPKPFDFVLGQLIVVALPEEAFFRGYLQSALDRTLGHRVRILGAEIGPALLLTSALFAIGHLATVPVPARLAVFFPSLVFGFLRARTGGIGAAILFHAACNILSEGLARGSGLITGP